MPRRTRVFGALAAAIVWAAASGSLPVHSQTPSVVLSMTCRISTSSGIPDFQVTITNAGSEVAAAVVGVVWRGENLPTNIGLTVNWPETQALDEFAWNPPRVEGAKTDPGSPWILTLLPHASRTLALSGADFRDVDRAVALRLGASGPQADAFVHLDSHLGTAGREPETGWRYLWSGRAYSMKVAVPGGCR